MTSEAAKLAITIGDPTGIGPEVALKALADVDLVQSAELTIVGDRQLLQQTYQRLSLLVKPGKLANPDQLKILDIPSPQRENLLLGHGTAASGAASFAYLEAGIDLALAGKVQGIVTGPIAKSAWKLAGQIYPGQTELLAERSGSEQYGMLFVARSPHTHWIMRTLLATTHIPLRQVPEALTPALMTRKLELLIRCLKQDFGLSQPRIAIAGLNPHSGEQGQLGQEEQDWLIPWIQQMYDLFPGATLQGPIPPDTMWVEAGQAWYGAEYGRQETGDRIQESEESSPLSLVTRHWCDNPAQGIDSQKLLAKEQITNDQGQKTNDNRQMTGSDSQGHLVNDAYLALYHDQGLIPVKLLAFDRAVNTSIGLPFIRTSPDHGTAFDIAGRGIADPTSMKAAIDLAIALCQQRISQEYMEPHALF